MKNKLFIRLFLVLINLIVGIAGTNAQMITTVAGSDSTGYGGDNGPATAAELHNPAAVVVDSSGNVYFSETANNCIRKVNRAGIITTFAGSASAGYAGNGGPATAALFNQPGTMGIDGMGNIYIADVGNNVVRRIGTNDTITTVAGTGAIGHTGDGGAAVSATLNKPSIAVDFSGDIYISDQNNFCIRKVNTSGIITTIAGSGVAGYSGDGGSALTAEMKPHNLGVDPVGNIYFVDSVTSVYRVIRKITPAGNINLFLNIWAESIAFDVDGNMYFSDVSCYVRKATPFGLVTVYAGDGSCTSSGDDGPATTAALGKPAGLTLDSSYIYVTEYSGARVRKISYIPTGINNISDNAETVKVYPNPASEEFTIDMPSAKGSVSIVISDILGKAILTRSVEANNGIKEEFDVKRFVPGTYLIKVSSGDKIYRQKVLVP